MKSLKIGILVLKLLFLTEYFCADTFYFNYTHVTKPKFKNENNLLTGEVIKTSLRDRIPFIDIVPLVKFIDNLKGKTPNNLGTILSLGDFFDVANLAHNNKTGKLLIKVMKIKNNAVKLTKRLFSEAKKFVIKAIAASYKSKTKIQGNKKEISVQVMTIIDDKKKSKKSDTNSGLETLSV